MDHKGDGQFSLLIQERHMVTALTRFARLLGLPAHQAEDAIYSERAARAVLTRRSFFAAGGAMAAGAVFSFYTPIFVAVRMWRCVGDWTFAYTDEIRRFEVHPDSKPLSIGQTVGRPWADKFRIRNTGDVFVSPTGDVVGFS